LGTQLPMIFVVGGLAGGRAVGFEHLPCDPADYIHRFRLNDHHPLDQSIDAA
jgi:hypothetical protein